MPIDHDDWDGLTERRQVRGVVERVATIEANQTAIARVIHEEIPRLRDSIEKLAEKIASSKPSIFSVMQIGIAFSLVVIALVSGLGYIGIVVPRQSLEDRVAALEAKNFTEAVARIDERQQTILKQLEKLIGAPVIGVTPRERQ